MSNPAKILIVDDNPDVVESMTIVLESEGYEVVTAANGTEGLHRIRSENPDLVILDVMMDTETEGLHVAYKLRSQEEDSEWKEFSHTPIIMVTSIHDTMDYRLDDAKGSEWLPVDLFLDKPVQPRELIARVKEALGRR